MPLHNTSERWGWPAKAFHWIVGLLMIGLLLVGFYMVTAVYWFYPESDAFSIRMELTQTHKSFGFLVFFLALARVVWRWYSPAHPDLPADAKGWERLASNGTHALLYVLMFLLPLSGWLMASTSPLNDADAYPAPIRNMVFGLFPMPDAMQPGDREVSNVFKAIHYYSGIALAALLALHIAAALKHHFVDRDGILRRMLPGGRA